MNVQDSKIAFSCRLSELLGRSNLPSTDHCRNSPCVERIGSADCKSLTLLSWDYSANAFGVPSSLRSGRFGQIGAVFRTPRGINAAREFSCHRGVGCVL